MTTLYSDSIRNFIRTRPWPTGLQWEVVEYDDYLGFRFFRDNFNSFDGETKLYIAMLVKELMEKIRADGIPIYMEKMESAYGRNE